MIKQQGRSTTNTHPPAPPSSPPALPHAAGRTLVSGGASGWAPLARKLWEQARKTLKGQFIVLAILVMLLAVGLAAFVSQTFSRAYADLDTIQHGSIPSVDAAQAMAQYVDDIDAKSADYLATAGLTRLVPCSVPGPDQATVNLTVHDCDGRTVDAEIILANQQLFNAAHNVTYPGERTAIERIVAGFQAYIADISLLRSEYQMAASKTDPRDPHLMNAYQAYKAANAMLQQRITTPLLTNTSGAPIFDEPNVPPCQIGNRVVQPNEWATGSIQDNLDCLSYINKSHLDQAYQDTVNFLGPILFLVGAFCLVFCFLLGFNGWRMAALTHRMLNVGLALAIVAGIGCSIATVGLFMSLYGQSGQHDASLHGAFQQIVRDDYDSVYYAALLKRDGTNANADESRWLIAVEFGDQPAVAHWQADWEANTQLVRDLIVRADNNQTWVQEIQPLADMHTYWDRYFAIDAHIRSLANDTTNPNHLNNAESLSTGDSNAAFGQFFDAVDRLSKANRDHGDSTYASAQGALQAYIPLSAILFPLVGLAAVWGISRRLKDF